MVCIGGLGGWPFGIPGISLMKGIEILRGTPSSSQTTKLSFPRLGLLWTAVWVPSENWRGGGDG